MTVPTWFDEFAASVDGGEPTALVCAACDATTLPPRQVCPACGARTLSPTPLPPAGEVVSYTEISVTTPKFHGETPYTVVLVALGDVTVTGQLRDGTADTITLGDRVEIGTEPREDGTPVITFVPAEA